MAKDPAFLFYYDRFLSGTISMSDEEVGQYIRLMCIQANKGFITKKDMLHICKSYDSDVCLKFADIGDSKYANAVLTEIVKQRQVYTESRRNNRKGTKPKNISSTYDTSYVPHMVNVNKDVIVNIEDTIKSAFDDLYIDRIRPNWKHVDFDQEHRAFCEKVRGSPDKYAQHDSSGLRLAFQSQLRNAKQTNNKPNITGKFNP